MHGLPWLVEFVFVAWPALIAVVALLPLLLLWLLAGWGLKGWPALVVGILGAMAQWWWLKVLNS